MICKEYNTEYFEDKPIWIAELSNGESIYQDDNAEKYEDVSAWIRLKKYLKINNLKIKKLYLRFRSNILHTIEENSEGYFFSMGIIGMMNSSTNVNYYIIGNIKNNKVSIKKIKVPELIVFDEEERELSSCTEEQLILNEKEANGTKKIREQQISI